MNTHPSYWNTLFVIIVVAAMVAFAVGLWGLLNF